MLKLLALGLALSTIAPLAGAAADDVRIHALPGATAFPESIGVDRQNGSFFTGSLVDGAIYRGSLETDEATLFLPAGADGRTNVAGVKVDPARRIWVADAFNGRLLVYDQQARLLHDFELAGPGRPTVNDIAFARGVAYITDSSRPFLYRVEIDDARQPGTTIVQPWLDVSSTVTYQTGDGPFGVNLNGIVASADGRTLLVVQTNTGMLFRVDVASGAIRRVAVDGAELLFGDGLLRVGGHVYVARNAANEVVELKVSSDWSSATAGATLTSPLFAFPTALARLGGRLLITNAQLNVPDDPTLPFTVVDLGLRAATA